MALIDDFKLHQDLHLQALKTLSADYPGLPTQLSELAPVVDAFDTASTKIANDANLTAIGRQNALQAERDKATATIDTWKTGKVTGIDAQMAAQESTLQSQADKATPAPSDAAVAAMAARLSGFDPFEVSVLYADATEPERILIERAAESIGRQPRKRGDALVWEHPLDLERIASVRAARLERENPAGVAAVRDLVRIRNVYGAMASAAVELLGK